MATTQRNYYIIDGNSYLYRAFFAIPQFTTKDGFVTNAIFGFFKMLMKLMQDKHCHEILVVFDHKGKSFRHEEYKEYKEHREKMPTELIGQIPYIQELVGLLGLPMLIIEGVEADDTIATLVTNLRTEENNHIYMITGDKDMMQLVGEHVFIYDTMKNVIYNREKVKEKMGVYPEKIIDLLGLMGDSADNIPGVPGVGPKTAVDLLSTYDNIEDIIAHRTELKGKLVEKFTEYEEQALFSKKLATVKKDVDISHIDLTMLPPKKEELLEFAKKLEFHSILREVEQLENISPSGTQKEDTPTRELPNIAVTTLHTWKEAEEVIQLSPSFSLLYTGNKEHSCLLSMEDKVYELLYSAYPRQLLLFLSKMEEKNQITSFGLKALFHALQELTSAQHTTSTDQLTLFA